MAALCLVGPACVPAVALCGFRAVTPFLAVALGGVMAAAAAMLMFVTAGPFLAWFAVVAGLANAAAATLLVSRRRSGWSPWPDAFGWEVVTGLTVGAGVVWPLMVLRAPVIGFDTEAIWLLHAAFIAGGHSSMVSGLTNPGYAFTNPGYPPLNPASVAVGYALGGAADQHLGVAIIASLTAGAVGLCGIGLSSVLPPSTGPLRRAFALLSLFVFVGAVFGVAGPYGVNGFADLSWSALAVAAVVFGIVAPKSPRNLHVACVCVAAAGLTKNEGLVTAVAIVGLVAARYDRGTDAHAWRTLRAAAVTGGSLVLPALWALSARAHGIKNVFFSHARTESASYRLGATLSGMWGQLHLVPVAVAVAILGWAALRAARRRLGLGAAASVWAVAWWGVSVVAATYVFGDLEIRYWLTSSIARTTVFVRALLLAEMVTWGLVLIVSPPASRRGWRSMDQCVEALPEAGSPEGSS